MYLETPSSSSRIKLLPEHIIDQIKAGEVIERPAGLLKELLENALDAQAKKIQIHLINNGLDLMSIIDDGVGMSFEDLPLAFTRHATSKLEKFEDLYGLSSFGFRGEALASGASISRLSCSSWSAEKKSGGKIEFHGGKLLSHFPLDGGTQGTSLFVKDLFYNVPARLKFVRSDTAEKNALKRIINAFILSHPEVSFSIKWDDREKDNFPAIASFDFVTRAQKILSKGQKGPLTLAPIEAQYMDLKLSGLVSVEASKGSTKSQFFFVNRRLVQDKQLHQSVMNVLKSFWPPQHTGHYVLFLDLPKDKVDVNVHPNKTIVKFENSSMVYSLIYSGIKKDLSQVQSVQEKVDTPEKSNLVDDYSPSLSEWAPPLNHSHLSFSSSDQELFRKPSYPSISSETFLRLENIGQEFILFHFEGTHYLLDLPKYLGHKFQTQILDRIPLNEQDITPLLISEPFSAESPYLDRYFPVLESIGLEFDRLSPHKVVLRTLPCILDGLSSWPHLIGQLLNFLSEIRGERPAIDGIRDFFSSKLILDPCLVSDHYLETCLREDPLNALLKSGTLLRLDLDTLKGLFRKS